MQQEVRLKLDEKIEVTVIFRREVGLFAVQLLVVEKAVTLTILDK